VCVCSASPGPLRQRLGGSNFAARPRCEVCYEKRRQWRRNNFINFADIPLSSAQVRQCVCAHKCRWNNASVCVAVLALLGRPAIVCLKVFHTPKSTMSALWLYRLIFLVFFFKHVLASSMSPTVLHVCCSDISCDYWLDKNTHTHSQESPAEPGRRKGKQRKRKADAVKA